MRGASTGATASLEREATYLAKLANYHTGRGRGRGRGDCGHNGGCSWGRLVLLSVSYEISLQYQNAKWRLPTSWGTRPAVTRGTCPRYATSAAAALNELTMRNDFEEDFGEVEYLVIEVCGG